MTPERLARRKATTDAWYKKQVAEEARRKREFREANKTVMEAKVYIEKDKRAFAWDECWVFI